MKPILSSIRLVDGLQSDGLPKEIVLDRLGEVVALCGPNGSGKTRALRRIARLFGQNEFGHPVESRASSGEDAVTFIEPFSADACRVLVWWNSTAALKDASDFTLRELYSFAGSSTSGDGRPLNVQLDALGFLQAISQDFFLGGSGGDQPPRLAAEQYNILQELLGVLLGYSLALDKQGRLRINGRLLTELNSSEGEKKSIQFCAAIAAITDIDSPLILLIDEPELHLHAATLLQLIEAFRARYARGHIILGTHSLPLVAHVGLRDTWFLNGPAAFQRGADARSDMVDRLLGGSKAVERLGSLLEEPAAAALTEFASECLMLPGVASFREDDPQIAHTIERLRTERARLNQPLKVLDYGAGKGRLAAGLATVANGADVNYWAFEPKETNHAELLREILRLHSSRTHERILATNEEVVSAARSQPFDVIVLMNVLHEVHPSLWANSLWARRNREVLADDGIVLIVEDLDLAVGETAYDDGYLLVSPSSLRVLFRSSVGRPIEHGFHKDPRYNRRLVIYGIPAPVARTVTMRSVSRCVDHLLDEARQEIIELRKHRSATWRSGRRHARLLAQIANATLIQRSLSSTG